MRGTGNMTGMVSGGIDNMAACYGPMGTPASPLVPPITANMLKGYVAVPANMFTDNGNSNPVTADGDLTQRWYDINGFYATQTVSAKRPVYKTNRLNGYPSALLTGVGNPSSSNQLMGFTTGPSSDNTGITAYFVGKPTADGTMWAANANWLQYRIVGGKQNICQCGALDVASGSATVSFADYKQYNFTWTENDAAKAYTFRYDKASDGSGTAAVLSPFIPDWVGCGFIGQYDPFYGDMILNFVYQGIHDLTTRQLMEAWITSVWGV